MRVKTSSSAHSSVTPQLSSRPVSTRAFMRGGREHSESNAPSMLNSKWRYASFEDNEDKIEDVDALPIEYFASKYLYTDQFS